MEAENAELSAEIENLMKGSFEGERNHIKLHCMLA